MRQVSTKSFPPPTSGWLASGNALSPPEDGAEVLDNWFPTARGARLRRGSRLHATLDATPVRMFSYRSGSIAKLFGATATDVYEISAPADPAVTPTALIATQTSGDWSTVQISTAGGDFLVAVNGADTGWTYDGSTNAALSITGVATTDLSHVNSFGKRLFFVEDGTMNVWYLPVDSIGGTATKFPLGSVFKKSGSVLFTATWSPAVGDSINDKFVAVSDVGEIAVYEGYDPASWSLAGVYEIGVPINKHGSEKVGGDLMFATTVGLVPISAAISMDLAQLAQGALSYKIEDAWRDAITDAASVHPLPLVFWRDESMFIVGTGLSAQDGDVSFVANPRTGAWGRYVGWDIQAGAIHEGGLYFGSTGGAVYEGDVTGSDNGTSYRGVYIPTFSTCGSPNIKDVQQVNAIFRGSVTAKWSASAFSDFMVEDVPASATLPEPDTSAAWGSFTWGSFTWGGSSSRQVTTNTWKGVRARGFSIAPCVVTQSLSTAAPDIEIMATQVRYETGAVL